MWCAKAKLLEVNLEVFARRSTRRNTFTDIISGDKWAVFIV